MSAIEPAIYLHIGRNKAGSTSLQDYFAAHAAWLASHRVQYALFGNLAGTVPGLPDMPNHYSIIEAIRRDPATSILISNEIIAALPEEHATRLAHDLAGRNVRVIFYVRPYRSWLRSSYSFDVRIGCNGRDFDAYLEHMRPRISFWPAARIWGETFGWDRVHVRSIDPRDLLAGDLITDCLAAIGLTMPPEPARKRSNETPNWIVTEMLRLAVGRDAAPQWDFTGLAVAEAIHEVVDAALADCGQHAPGVKYLTRAQAHALADDYNADLWSLAAVTGVALQPDDASDAAERGFLPSARHVPQAVLRNIAARTLAPGFARLHPEAAAFVAGPAFSSLLDDPPGQPVVVRAPTPTYMHAGDTGDGAAESVASRQATQGIRQDMLNPVLEQERTGTAVAEAFRRAAQGDLDGAIALGSGSARGDTDIDLLTAMVQWRRDAFSTAPARPPPPAWPPAVADPFPGLAGIPVVAVADLTPAILGGAIMHHGALRVNGLVSRETAEKLQKGIDRALDARDAFKNGGGAAAAGGWYVPADVPTLFREREWVENGGAVWTADCPPMLAEVIEAFTACRVIDHIAGFMGERPALSIGKSTLRRVPTTLLDTDWHQDGAFLGADVRAMNVWLALSPCGADAPGLEIVGARLPYVVQTGSHGANFNWSVGPGLVDILGQGGAKLESPEFAPGDALLFDHLMLHRTGLRPGMTRPRWAIESWFFSPTHYPAEQVPLMV